MNKTLLLNTLTASLILSVELVNACDSGVDYCGNCGDDCTWAVKGTALTISGTGDMYNYNVDPGSTGNNTTFRPWPTNITSVEFQGNITSIGENAFNGNVALESFTIPDSVTSIGLDAFKGISMTSLVLPESLFAEGAAGISKYALVGSNITTIYCPEGNTACQNLDFSKRCALDSCYSSDGKSCGCGYTETTDPVTRQIKTYSIDPESGQVKVGSKIYASLDDLASDNYINKKRIYSVSEAAEASNKDTNTFMIRYK